MIGIIVPFYKNEAYINRCLDSILAQSFTDFKLFLVDDGSPDRCGEICDEYAEKHRNITVIHQQNQGLSAARNAGIEVALADNEIDWITFVDGDDWVHKECLMILYKACVDTNSDISISHFLRTDGSQCVEEEIDYNVSVINSDTAISLSNSTISGIVAWGKLYKKQLFEQVRFPIGKYHEDEFTTYKVLSDANSIAVVERTLYYYFINYEGIMLSKWSPQRLDALEAYVEQLKFFKEKSYSLSFEKAQHKLLRGVEYSIIASDGNQEADDRIKEAIKVIYSDFYPDLSSKVKKRLKRLKPFSWFRFRNKVKVFRNYLREKGFEYAFEKLLGQFRKG